VVVVVHEIFGVSKWIIGVTDQLAADGFIAIAPNLLSGTVELQQDTSDASAARAAIGRLDPLSVHRRIAAVGQWGMSQPSATRKYGVVGFCWGGGASFSHSIHAAEGMSAAVVYYGSPIGAGSSNLPDPDYRRIQAPVLGLYGGADARITATVPASDSTMKAVGKPFEYHILEGAGHGFLRQQGDGNTNLANRTASEKAWPLTLQFFRKHLAP
jgi:carboxymethylenebutenolidase